MDELCNTTHCDCLILAPVLRRVTRDNDSKNDSFKIESFQWFMREEFLFGDH